MAVPCFPWSEAAPRSPQTSACATSASKRHQAPPLGGARLRPLAPRRGSFVPLRRAHLEQSFPHPFLGCSAPRRRRRVCVCRLLSCGPVAVPRAGAGAGGGAPRRWCRGAGAGAPRRCRGTAGAGVPPPAVARTRKRLAGLHRTAAAVAPRACRALLLAVCLSASACFCLPPSSVSKRQQAPASVNKR